MDTTIELAEAAARFLEIMDRVAAGETIFITRDARILAEIRPLQRTNSDEAAARIRALGERVAERNAHDAPWPAQGQSLRQVAHERRRR